MFADPQKVAERLQRQSVAPPQPKIARGPKPDAERQGQRFEIKDPEPWPESVDGAALADEISAAFSRFVSLPAGTPDALTLWTLHTHAFSAASISPILFVTSPEKRCGKSTLLRLLKRLVRRALLASNLTPAVLFRVVDRHAPTLLIDEGDSFLSERPEFRNLLNSGHCKDSASVLRSVGEDFEPRAFGTWAPKAIAAIGRLPDTVVDRSIKIHMNRRRPHDRLEKLSLAHEASLAPLLRKAWRWSQDNAVAIGSALVTAPEELNDRAADNWLPLFAIAHVLGEDWPTRARAAALSLSGKDDDEGGSPGMLLLQDFSKLFENPLLDPIRSSDVPALLGELEDRKWGEWGRSGLITPAQVARLLKPFGIAPRMVRDGSETFRGYRAEFFEEVFERYLPLKPQQAQQNRSGAENLGGAGCDQAPPAADAVIDRRARLSRGVAAVAAVRGQDWCAPARAEGSDE